MTTPADSLAVPAGLVDDLRVVWLVADNLSAEVAADPFMPASEVLRRIRAVLPAIPETPTNGDLR